MKPEVQAAAANALKSALAWERLKSRGAKWEDVEPLEQAMLRDLLLLDGLLLDEAIKASLPAVEP